uniref:Glycosyl hydrolase 1 n=1 Tax=Solanum tuberosum TaxID=4113 RepID=M1A6G1_SOLTU
MVIQVDPSKYYLFSVSICKLYNVFNKKQMTDIRNVEWCLQDISTRSVALLQKVKQESVTSTFNSPNAHHQSSLATAAC